MYLWVNMKCLDGNYYVQYFIWIFQTLFCAINGLDEANYSKRLIQLPIWHWNSRCTCYCIVGFFIFFCNICVYVVVMFPFCLWTSLPNFPTTTLVKFLSSFIKRTAKILAWRCNWNYMPHLYEHCWGYYTKTRGSQEPVIVHLVFNLTSKVDRKWGCYT